jgi:hypothetical protein
VAVYIYTQTLHRTTQIITKQPSVRSVPRLCEFYPGICLTTEEKARKNLIQGKKSLSRVKKNLSHSTVYILPKTPTHYKALLCMYITHTVLSTVLQSPIPQRIQNTDWCITVIFILLYKKADLVSCSRVSYKSSRVGLQRTSCRMSVET